MSETREEVASQKPTQQAIPPSFQPGEKVGKDGTVFRKNPERELFDQRWREAVARGEDPKQNLKQQVDNTRSSSFIEYWWRKAGGKKKTRAEEKVEEERRQRERVEGGSVGLLESEGGSGDGGASRGECQGSGKRKWHDKLRWGI